MRYHCHGGILLLVAAPQGPAAESVFWRAQLQLQHYKLTMNKNKIRCLYEIHERDKLLRRPQMRE